MAEQLTLPFIVAGSKPGSRIFWAPSFVRPRPAAIHRHNGTVPTSDVEEKRDCTSRSASSSDPGGLAARDYYETKPTSTAFSVDDLNVVSGTSLPLL
jgi:hypothetical protein